VRCEQAGPPSSTCTPATRRTSPLDEFKIFEEIYRGLKERSKLIVRFPPAAGRHAYEQRSDR